METTLGRGHLGTLEPLKVVPPGADVINKFRAV